MNMPTPASWAKVAHDANLVDDEMKLDPAACSKAGMERVEAIARRILHDDPRFSSVRAKIGYIPRPEPYNDGKWGDPLALATLKNQCDLESALSHGKPFHRKIPIVRFKEKLEHGDGGHVWVRSPQQAVAHATIHVAASTTRDVEWEPLDALIWGTVFNGTFVANASAQAKRELYNTVYLDLTDQPADPANTQPAARRRGSGHIDRTDTAQDGFSNVVKTNIDNGTHPDPTADSVVVEELRQTAIRHHAALPGDKDQIRAAYLDDEAIYGELSQGSDQRYEAIPGLAARSGLPDPGESMARFIDPLKTRGWRAGRAIELNKVAGRASQLNKVLFAEMFEEFGRSHSGIPAA